MYRYTIGIGLEKVVDSLEVAIAAYGQNRYRQGIESAKKFLWFCIVGDVASQNENVGFEI